MPAAKKTGGRVAVRAVNHATGETWSIHDERTVCEAELARVLKAWGDAPVDVDWDELVSGIDDTATDAASGVATEG